MGDKQRWVMKQRKKRERKKLADARKHDMVTRLRDRVAMLAQSAMELSRRNQCMSYYTRFEIREGRLWAGAEQIKNLTRKDCERFINLGFEPIDPKGHLEVLVDVIDRASGSDQTQSETRKDSRMSAPAASDPQARPALPSSG